MNKYSIKYTVVTSYIYILFLTNHYLFKYCKYKFFIGKRLLQSFYLNTNLHYDWS